MAQDNGLASVEVQEQGTEHGRLMDVPLDRIRENQVRLREVDKENLTYQGIVDSVKKNGILNPIVVRELEDPENPGQKLYGLIDGLHRYNAALDAGLKSIPAHIRNADQAKIEELQIIANSQKVETRPAQYADQMYRLLMRNPLMTVEELAGKVSKTPEWLYKQFGLLKLPENIQKLVDEGKIKLTNAYNLAKLPAEDIDPFLERAMTDPPDIFMAAVSGRIKEIRDARAEGRKAGPVAFQAVAHQRKWTEIKGELESNCPIGRRLIKEEGITDPGEAWKLAIQWVASIDKRSIEQQRAEYDARQRDKEEKKKAKELERAEKRKKEAAEIYEKYGQPVTTE